MTTYLLLAPPFCCAILWLCGRTIRIGLKFYAHTEREIHPKIVLVMESSIVFALFGTEQSGTHYDFALQFNCLNGPIGRIIMVASASICRLERVVWVIMRR